MAAEAQAAGPIDLHQPQVTAPVSSKEWLEELRRLAEAVEDVKCQLAALRPGQVRAQIIPGARNELDAVVDATEHATFEILGAAEALEELIPALDAETAEKMRDVSTRIFEASTFQDITGQRIAKVARALDGIEDRIARLLDLVADDSVDEPAEVADAGPDDAGLMNGPQLEGEGMSQDEIDRLLNGTD